MNATDLFGPFSHHRQPTSKLNNVLPGVGLFGSGILVGAGVALLLAPKSGARLRADIARGSEDLKRRATDRAQQLMNGKLVEEDESPDPTHERLLARARSLHIDRAETMSKGELAEAISSAS